MATQHDLANKIVHYIHTVGDVSYDDLHERAKTKEWYTRDRFDAVMLKVGKYDTITVTKELVYKKRTLPPRAPRPILTIHTPLAYPPLIEGVNDASHPIFSDMCLCKLFCTQEAWRKNKQHKVHCYLYGDSRGEDTARDS